MEFYIKTKFNLNYFKGFDEYMNLVLEDAVEVNTKKNARTPIGKHFY